MSPFLLLILAPACLALPVIFESPISPGEMAEIVFTDADSNDNKRITMGELLAMFLKYDANSDGRVTRTEFQNYVNDNEPDLVPFYLGLYNTFDFDGNHVLELQDYVHMYTSMAGQGAEYISEWDFIGYFTRLFKENAHLHNGMRH